MSGSDPTTSSATLSQLEELEKLFSRSKPTGTATSSIVRPDYRNATPRNYMNPAGGGIYNNYNEVDNYYSGGVPQQTIYNEQYTHEEMVPMDPTLNQRNSRGGNINMSSRHIGAITNPSVNGRGNPQGIPPTHPRGGHSNETNTNERQSKMWKYPSNADVKNPLYTADSQRNVIDDRGNVHGPRNPNINLNYHRDNKSPHIDHGYMRYQQDNPSLPFQQHNLDVPSEPNPPASNTVNNRMEYSHSPIDDKISRQYQNDHIGPPKYMDHQNEISNDPLHVLQPEQLSRTTNITHNYASNPLYQNIDSITSEKTILIYIDLPMKRTCLDKDDLTQIFERFATVKDVVIVSSIPTPLDVVFVAAAIVRLGSLAAVSCAIMVLNNLRLPNVGILRCVNLTDEPQKMIPSSAYSDGNREKSVNSGYIYQQQYSTDTYNARDHQRQIVHDMNSNSKFRDMRATSSNSGNIYSKSMPPRPIHIVFSVPSTTNVTPAPVNYMCRFELIQIFDHPEFDVPAHLLGPRSSHFNHILKNSIAWKDENNVDCRLFLILSGTPLNELPADKRLHITVHARGFEWLRSDIEKTFLESSKMVNDLVDNVIKRFGRFVETDKNTTSAAFWRRHDYTFNGSQSVYVGIGDDGRYERSNYEPLKSHNK